jgi:hypothetical protein
LENREKPVILLMQKWHSFKHCLGSRHTLGTANGIDLWVPFNQPAKALEQGPQQIFGAQILS